MLASQVSNGGFDSPHRREVEVRARSSIGRAPVYGTGGWGFEALRARQCPRSSTGRAFASGAKGCWFEPSRGREWLGSSAAERRFHTARQRGFESLSSHEEHRRVAQPGSAPVWGTGGRGFKSRFADEEHGRRTCQGGTARLESGAARKGWRVRSSPLPLRKVKSQWWDTGFETRGTKVRRSTRPPSAAWKMSSAGAEAPLLPE